MDTESDFEWDDEKNAANRRKHHGVAFDEAQTVFSDLLAYTIHDLDHSQDEDRWLTTGLSSKNRLLIVSHTDRGDKIRIISARPLTPAERRDFENGKHLRD